MSKTDLVIWYSPCEYSTEGYNFATCREREFPRSEDYQKRILLKIECPLPKANDLLEIQLEYIDKALQGTYNEIEKLNEKKRKLLALPNLKEDLE